MRPRYTICNVDEIEAQSETSESLLPFEDLEAPAPLAADPPPTARWLAFGSILLAGLLGGIVGYGVGDVMGRSSDWAAIGALIGGLGSAIGVGIVANLTLRAMNEWHSVTHPEEVTQSDNKAEAGPKQPLSLRVMAWANEQAVIKQERREDRDRSKR